jgi:hypothetical protein
LGEPVEDILDQFIVQEATVAHRGGTDAQDGLGLVEVLDDQGGAGRRGIV